MSSTFKISGKWSVQASKQARITLFVLQATIAVVEDRERRIPRPLNCFQKQRVGYRVGQGFVSRNASRNTRGRVQGEVLLVPLISCSNEATRPYHTVRPRMLNQLRLRDTVCAWRSTAHAHGWFSMDFELTPLVMSSIFFFEPKIAFSVYGSEET